MIEQANINSQQSAHSVFQQFLMQAATTQQTFHDEIRKLISENCNTEKPYLDVSEACQFLSISKNTLYKLNHRKELRYYKTGKKVFYARDSLIEYITKNKILSKDDIESQAYYQAKRLRNRL